MILKVNLAAGGGRLQQGVEYANRLFLELGRSLVEAEGDNRPRDHPSPG